MKSVAFALLGLCLTTLLASCATAPDRGDGRTYLISLVDLPLRQDDAVETFSLVATGVIFKAVCRIPDGWTIRAGGGLNGEGWFNGEGSNGITWPRDPSPAMFRDLVLVAAPNGVHGTAEHDGGGPTFSGAIRVQGLDDEVDLSLDRRNIRATPAGACPPLKGNISPPRHPRARPEGGTFGGASEVVEPERRLASASMH